MTKTEKKYWVNGLDIRTNSFSKMGYWVCLTFSLGNFGCLIASNPTIEFFKLEGEKK